MVRYLYLIFLLVGLPLIISAQVNAVEELKQQAVSDSLTLVREREILSEYGFRDVHTLQEVAKKLEIKEFNTWKRFLGFEPQNQKVDGMSLRKLGITPYRALLAQQFSVYGYTELSTVNEVAASMNMPIKKMKQMMKLEEPTSRKWDNYSLQALDWTPQDIQALHEDFLADSIGYGASVTLVGMLTVFAALLFTSLTISQLIHLNHTPKPKKPHLKISPGGKVIAASATLNRNVIVAIITALHMHQHSTEERKRMALTFRRTPTNQWRASGVLSMPNREMNAKRR